jgi:hypothetical protein
VLCDKTRDIWFGSGYHQLAHLQTDGALERGLFKWRRVIIYYYLIATLMISKFIFYYTYNFYYSGLINYIPVKHV